VHARDRDQYGRIIAVCYADEADVNEIMVREGLAWAFTRYSEDYVTVEVEARTARVGVWQGEAEAPWDYRANRWERATAESPRSGCPIKGNINREGEKICHTPWSPWYDRTVIEDSKGQRWFCDEAEAEAAGWRPARWRCGAASEPTMSQDAQLRLAAAEHVKRLAVGNTLTSEELRAGFQFDGERIPLINPQRGYSSPETWTSC
jgi:hypothetical protein